MASRFAEFCAEFVKPRPPKDLAYYGSWGTWESGDEDITATVYTIDGPERVKAPLAELQLVVPCPTGVRSRSPSSESRIAELEARDGEKVSKLT